MYICVCVFGEEKRKIGHINTKNKESLNQRTKVTREDLKVLLDIGAKKKTILRKV